MYLSLTICVFDMDPKPGNLNQRISIIHTIYSEQLPPANQPGGKHHDCNKQSLIFHCLFVRCRGAPQLAELLLIPPPPPTIQQFINHRHTHLKHMLILTENIANQRCPTDLPTDLTALLTSMIDAIGDCKQTLKTHHFAHP